ncbi:hypothetical protein F5879DRAFT_723327 [Lentinula edodes]|nr:hypothetical protein F5879DRAFT_723327 [Lentinula edodes]
MPDSSQPSPKPRSIDANAAAASYALISTPVAFVEAQPSLASSRVNSIKRGPLMMICRFDLNLSSATRYQYPVYFHACSKLCYAGMLSSLSLSRQSEGTGNSLRKGNVTASTRYQWSPEIRFNSPCNFCLPFLLCPLFLYLSSRPYSHHEHSNVRRQDPRQHSHHDDMDIDADNTTRRMRQPFQQHDSEIPNGYSFRSFRGPQQYRSSNSSYSSQPQYSQSSPGGGSGMFRFNVPDNGFSYSREREHNPSYSRSRPPTDTTARPGTSTRPATATTLPPLASIVPSSIAPLPPPPTSHARPGSNAGFSGRPLSNAGFGGILGGYGSSFPSFGHTGAPLPTLSGSKSANGLRLPPPTPSNLDLRPGSRGGSSQGTFAYRPGTAPALGPGTTSNHNGYAGYGMVFGWEDERSSGESPFSFNAPPLSSSGSRKRGFSAVDEGDGDDRASESRPQSRRLSVMELCAPEDIPGRPESSSGSGILFTPIRDREYPSTTSGSRPGTSGTGLIVRGAAGLALGDRENGTAGGPTSKSKRESPGGTAIYYPNNASSKPASPRPSATIPSPFPANAARPSSSGSHRSCSPSRSPVESDRHGHGHGHVSGYGQHGRQRSGSGYRQYGVIGGGHGAGYGSPLSNPGQHTSEHGLAARSPGSDASVSPATSTRSPLSAGSASPPSAVSTASVHAWR